MTPVAVDANVIHAFQEERIAGTQGDGHATVSRIFQNDCIALDTGGACLQEWIECAGGAFPFALSDWVNDQLATGLIRTFDMCKSMHRELSALGLPRKDHKWIRLAIGSNGNCIITNDIDLFDPTAKTKSAQKKEAIRKSGGACSKHLMKYFGVSVLCMKLFAANEV